jgi:murein DD-endopeptidase MepM/ murein hydrolase activator NlpD
LVLPSSLGWGYPKAMGYLKQIFSLTFSFIVLITIASAPKVNALEPNPNWTYPIENKKVVRPYEPPLQNWLAGHRGIDFAAPVNTEVHSVGFGTVIYAGPLASKGVVVINHGLVRTTYEPVKAVVSIGDEVKPGQLIGTLEIGESHCSTQTEVFCLHLGAIRDGKYLNPLLLIKPRVRLLPLNN